MNINYLIFNDIFVCQACPRIVLFGEFFDFLLAVFQLVIVTEIALVIWMHKILLPVRESIRNAFEFMQRKVSEVLNIPKLEELSVTRKNVWQIPYAIISLPLSILVILAGIWVLVEGVYVVDKINIFTLVGVGFFVITLFVAKILIAETARMFRD